MANLQKQIENLNNEISSQLPEETLSAFTESIAELKKAGMENDCIREGMKMSGFTLKSIDGADIHSDALLDKFDKIILVFFRGIWCPYCNLELKVLQDSESKLNTNKVKLIAISPQKKEYSLSMKKENKIAFDILVDENNAFAKQLGISYHVQDFVIPYYQQLGIDLKQYNENSDTSLPIPAVFVVDKDYNVTYSFIDVNYMTRVNIDELIMNL